MPRDTFSYSNDQITVIWKPNMCIHSTLCWKGLIAVFNPKEKPWVKMDGATSERIVEQIRKCPSGALSYRTNENDAMQIEPAKKEGPVENGLTIEVTPGGPYLIKTECTILHSNGKEEKKTGTVALCRCGASANKPYCDGSHRNSGLKD